MREWLVIESTKKNGIFAEEKENRRGYIPRDVVQRMFGKELDDIVWFSKEESAAMRAHPEWRDTEPPMTPVFEHEFLEVGNRRWCLCCDLFQMRFKGQEKFPEPKYSCARNTNYAMAKRAEAKAQSLKS